MSWLQYTLLGLGTGAAYVLLAQGILLIYRGSAIVNFSHGGFAMLAAYLYNVELRDYHGWGVLPAFVVTVVIVGILAALVHPLIMRPLREAAPLIRVIATLGILIVIQAGATLKWGQASVPVLPVLPQHTFHIAHGVTMSADRLLLVVIAVATTAGLYAYSRFTTMGIATRGAAENQRAASVLGWSPDLLATVNWGAGGVLAAAAGILITPYAGLNINILTLAVIAALAAALLGSFRSFPIVLLGGLLIGVLRSLLVGPLDSIYHQEGSTDAVPFLIILVVLVVRGRSLPLRGSIIDRLPSLGTGQIRARFLVPVILVAGFLVLEVFDNEVDIGIGVSVVAAIIMLSIVVLTGYAGQLSLAQYALAGLGALFAARIAVGQLHWPFPLALLTGIVGAAVSGVVFALPALRTRGVNLAVITLGLGLAVQSVVFASVSFAGGTVGTPIPSPSFFGFDVDPIAKPQNYTLFCILCFVVVGLLVSNLRRGRAGRRLIAVRTNERAAAALGVDVTRAKIFAFAMSAAIAGLGGTLLAFSSPSVVLGSGYDPTQSINAVGLTVAGGTGYVGGPLLGSLLQTGGLGTVIADKITSLDKWFPLAGGISLLLILLTNPDGQASVLARQIRAVTSRLPRRRATGAPPEDALPEDALPERPLSERPLPERPLSERPLPERALPGAGEETAPEHVSPQELQVEGLTVRFGGVTALSGVSVTVAPGEVVGLMGPNGAGKTTFIDAVSGFVTAAEGRVTFGGRDITELPAYRRAQLGLSRSFQSLELFDDVTVRENLLTAADSTSASVYLTDVFWRSSAKLPPQVVAAVRELGLAEDLERRPSELSFGRRRLVAIARAIAANPSVVMLDEPGAGLDEHECAELGHLIRRLAVGLGIGVVLVEHDVQMLLSTCDRVVVLDFGRPIAIGTPDEIRHDAGVISAYLGDEDVVETIAATPELIDVGDNAGH